MWATLLIFLILDYCNEIAFSLNSYKYNEENS